MDAQTRHYLNGVEVPEPMAWADFTEELDRDIDSRFISLKYRGTLTFTNEGYALLDSVFRDTGHCGIVSYLAIQQCGGQERIVARGSIIVADIKFNLTKCEAECSIADDGIGARVMNNMEIPVSPNADVSKNGKSIGAVSQLDIELYDPQAALGTYLTGARLGWDWLDAIRHAVRYITDDTVTLVSDWYAALPDDERYWISNGYSVRSASIAVVRTSWTFKDLFEEIGKKYNLWIGVERSATGEPVLRIEPEGYWYSATPWGSHPDIQDLIRTADSDLLYAKVDVGCDKAIKETETDFSLPYIPLRGFVQEAFHLEGVCNTQATLDLVSQWIIDSNVIEDAAVNLNKDYDDDLFIVQYDRTTNRAVKGDYLQPGSDPYLYNPALLNDAVIARHNLPSAVGAFFDPVNASFRAQRTTAVANPYLTYDPGTSAVVETEQAQFNDDFTAPNFDTANAWGNGTAQGTPVSAANSRYTAPAQGYYEFEVFARFRVIQQLVSRNGPLAFAYPVQLQLVLERYDSGNNLISSQTVDTPSALNQWEEQSITHVFGTSMNAGDYVRIVDQFLIQSQTWVNGISDFNLGFGSGVTFQRLPNWYIKTNFVASGGYVAAGGGGRIIRYEFDRHVSSSDWVSLTADPRRMILIGTGEPSIRTHIINASRNVMTGATTWAVIEEP